MKRKLDERDVPVVDAPLNSAIPAPTFESLGLDPRILQAVSALKFSRPTRVQAEAIPLALAGKDILGWSKIKILTL